jgi:predicted enzyme related to lactoylglutathione lyase
VVQETTPVSIQVKALAYVYYPVTDVARARGFYEGFLGLKPGLQEEHTPGQWWIEYDLPAGQTLAISNLIPGAGTAKSVMLEVADLDAALKSAKAEAITIALDVMEFPPCRMFAVNDPDGNQVGLHQRKQSA